MSLPSIFRAVALLLLLAGVAACQSTGSGSNSTPTDQKAGNGY